MSHRLPRACAALLLAFSSLMTPMRVDAGVLAAATRVIYTQGEHEQSLMLANTNDYPVVVQTWVDRGEADPNILAPFVSLPSVFQLLPEARQGIRILLADADILPQDRESVFWLNLHEVPPTLKASGETQQDTLALAMNMQLKIFYRPAGLPETDVAQALRFKLVQADGAWYVQCDNPTPYHASFTALSVVDKKTSLDTPVRSEMDMMTTPFAQRRYLLGDNPPAGRILRYTLVDDAGFARQFETVVERNG